MLFCLINLYYFFLTLLKLYKCILDAPAGTELTNTTYFALQTRTKTQANRFLVEIPFGHIHKQTIDAIRIDRQERDIDKMLRI